MKSHKGKSLFITGIPTSGKSYPAEKLAKEVIGIAVLLDNYRKDLAKKEKYGKWTDFLFDKNEYEYLTQTTPDQLWKNLVAQSEGLWPAFSQEIEKHKNEEKSTKMKKNLWYLSASIYFRILQNNI
jgi:adenylate kinase family enzyme